MKKQIIRKINKDFIRKWKKKRRVELFKNAWKIRPFKLTFLLHLLLPPWSSFSSIDFFFPLCIQFVWWLDERLARKKKILFIFLFSFPRGMCTGRAYTALRSAPSSIYWLVLSTLVARLSFHFLPLFDSSALCSVSLQWRPSRREIASHSSLWK